MGTHWNVREASGGPSGEGVAPHYREVVPLSMTLVGSVMLVIVLFCSVLVCLFLSINFSVLM